MKNPMRHWRRLRWQFKTACQLTRRGWADQDTWGLDNTLCKRLGAQLLHLADTTHVWPDRLCPTYEEWQAVLRQEGTALVEYVTRPGYTEVLNKWYDLKYGENAGHFPTLRSIPDAPEVKEAWVTLNTLEARYDYEAEQALHWVAEHLGYLWD